MFSTVAVRAGRGMTETVLFCILMGGALADARAADTEKPQDAAPTPVQADTNAVADSLTNAPAPSTNAAVVESAVPPTNAMPETVPGTNVVAPPPVATRPESLAGFRVRPGFRIELVAAEPLVAAPSAIAFDENGRLYVTEMRDYPDRREAGPHLGRVKLLENQNEQGVFKSSSILAEDLALPSAIVCYSGGIFVAATPDILFLKDTRGTGVADVRRIVFNGFAGTNAINPEGLLNSFQWGMDNRVHASTAGIGGYVNPIGVAVPGALVWGSDFSFDPRSLNVQREPGPSQSGLCFDLFGRKFLTNLQRPLFMPMYDPRYMDRNAFFARPPDSSEVASPATAVFKLSKVVVPASTNRQSATVAGEREITVSGWLTNARSPAIYTGTAFASNFQNNVFIPDPEAHVIHRVVLRESGLDVIGTRAPEDRELEFVASADPLFRPVQVVNGPDGALYVADMRESGDSGRIYRIVPENFKPAKPPQLGQAKTYDLVAALASPSGWHRTTAARLLYERRDPAAVPLLADMLGGSRIPIARLHALNVLDSLGALNEPMVLRALRDIDEHIRERAVRLSEKLVTNAFVTEPLWAQLRTMSGDPSPRVRYQLAFTLGESRRSPRIALLAQTLAADPNNRWVQAAVLSSLGDLKSAWLPSAIGGGAADLLSGLLAEQSFRNSPAGLAFLNRLATMIGTKGSQLEVAQTIDLLDRAPIELPVTMSVLASFGEGLHLTRSGLALADRDGRLKRFYTEAHNVALNDTLPDTVRLPGIRLLGVSPYGFSDVPDLLLLFGTGQSAAIQSATLSTLTKYPDPRIMTNLLGTWTVLSPALRRDTLSMMLGRADRAGPLLQALEAGAVPPGDLTSQHANFLRTFNLDAALAARAVRLLGPVDARRPAALERYRPSLRISGVPQRGRTVFVNRCASCHRLGADGTRFGPDLEGVRVYGRERILTAILEPGAQMRQGFESYVVYTHSGECATGVPGGETPFSLTLREPGGKANVFSRPAVQDTFPQPWSMMPAGLEQGLTQQDMADLLAWILTAPRTID